VSLSDYLYYHDDWATIYNADCREILPLLEPVDLVLTDPPYGIKIADKELGSGRSTGIASTKMFYGKWDNNRFSEISSVLNNGENQIVWGGNYYADLLPPSQGWLVWDKRNGLPTRSYADVELAWTSFDHASRLFRWRWDGFIREGEIRFPHPTQKPIELMKWCLSFAHGTILDPFMGSGTTLVAAKNLNRKSIGIEIEPKYCEIAVKRLRQEVFDLRNKQNQ
jgi:site-specific DNA-methyltransferase (adenine-specific)